VRPSRCAALLALAACSRHAEPAPSESASAATAAPSSPEASTEAGGRGADRDSRFPGQLAAIAWEVKVREGPNLQSKMLGYLRAGAVVPSAAEPVSRTSCSGGWYAIEPSGYVCVEPNVATTDVNDPIARALSRRPDPNGPFPYMYGLVHQHSPIYSRLPQRLEAARKEYALAQHMAHWLRSKKEDGANFRADSWMRWKDQPAPDPAALWEEHTTQEVPAWLEGGAQPPGNLSRMIVGRRLVVGDTLEHQGFAFIDTVVNEGRRYAITTDLLVIPVDRLRPIEGSGFHGVRIPEDIEMPFALVRREGAHAFTLRGDEMVRGEAVARRAAIKLTGKEQVVDKRRYFETADGKWLSETHCARVDKVRGPITKWQQDGEHWIDVSVANQTLVAYAGTKPVYATLVSTGEAGLNDPQTTKSTVLGEFRIFAKHRTTTMSSEVVGEEFQLKDIPYVQYFQEGYALHAAYWHDDFGIPRSHGCINLSPEDARWLFAFTGPELPALWHGARAEGTGSVVVVHP
jgi:lipoprotein-anchoring transpeptidase ErfK/SrfK